MHSSQFDAKATYQEQIKNKRCVFLQFLLILFLVAY